MNKKMSMLIYCYFIVNYSRRMFEKNQKKRIVSSSLSKIEEYVEYHF